MTDSTREDIISLLRFCVQKNRSANQQLADLVIPEDAYKIGKAIVPKVTFKIRYHHSEVFTILLPLCDEVPLSQGKEKVRAWQKGLKALLRYINNLLLAPNRPELKSVKVSSSYFHFQVRKHLKEAESYLNLVGYQRVPNSTDLVLKNFSLDRAYQLVADIIVLHEDLEVVHFLLTRTDQMSITLNRTPIEFKHVLLGRQYGPAKQLECLDFIMEGKAEVSPWDSPQLSSDRREVNYTNRDNYGSTNVEPSYNHQRFGNAQSGYGDHATKPSYSADYRPDGRSNYDPKFNNDTRYEQRYNDPTRFPDEGYGSTCNTGISEYRYHQQQQQGHPGASNRISHDGAYNDRSAGNYRESARPPYNFQRSRSYERPTEYDDYPQYNQDRYYNESPRYSDQQSHFDYQHQSTSSDNSSFDLSSSFSSTTNMPPPMMNAQQMELQMRKYNHQMSSPLPDVKTGQIESLPGRVNSQDEPCTPIKYDRRSSSTPSFRSTPSIQSESSFEKRRYKVPLGDSAYIDAFSPEPIPEHPSFQIGEDNEVSRPPLTKDANFDSAYYDNGRYHHQDYHQAMPLKYDSPSHYGKSHAHLSDCRRSSADDVLQSSYTTKGYDNSGLYRQDSKTWGGERNEGEETRKAIRHYSSQNNLDNNYHFRRDSELTAGCGGLQVIADGGSGQKGCVTNDSRIQCNDCGTWYDYNSSCTNCAFYYSKQDWNPTSHSSPYSSISNKRQPLPPQRTIQTDNYNYYGQGDDTWMCDLCSNVNSASMEECGACGQQGKK